MHAAAEDLHSFGQVGRVWQRDQGLLLAQVLDILERNGLPFSSLLGQLVEGCYVLFFGMCEADYEQQVRVQVAVVEGADGVAGAGVLAQQNDIGRAGLDE